VAAGAQSGFASLGSLLKPHPLPSSPDKLGLFLRGQNGFQLWGTLNAYTQPSNKGDLECDLADPMPPLLLARCPALCPGGPKAEIAGGIPDYYVLALSWAPENGVRRSGALARNFRAMNDADATDHGWIMHGLWPRYHRGFPSIARTACKRPPTQRHRPLAMATSWKRPVVLIWHQWYTHAVRPARRRIFRSVSERAYEAVTPRPPSSQDHGDHPR